jgi:MerR family redox-sensitive transcriptional activator SoxR
MDGFPELTIGEVAQRARVATSSIRYYERIGLLPEPDREGGQRRYDAEVLGKLGFIGVAQSAGFKLREIKELVTGVNDANGLGEQMRSLSSQKLDEVEALLERTNAMKGWLEVAKECGCATPAECALFPAIGEERPDADLALRVVSMGGKDCRRPGARPGLLASAEGEGFEPSRGLDGP